MLQNLDDKDLAIGAIALIALGAMAASACGVEVTSIVSHSVTAIAGLATGRVLQKKE